MAIEKMTFIDIKGSSDYLDEILIRCARCGIFQPESAAKLSEYSIGTTTLMRNPYGALQVKIGEIATQLDIALEYREDEGASASMPTPDAYIEQTHAYLNNLRAEYPKYFARQRKIGDDIASYSTALEMLRHIDAPDLNFDELWENKFLKIRFGRMPTPSLQKLEVYDDKPYETYKLESGPQHTWLLYMTAGEFRDDIDAMFADLGFERLRIPDYVHGTASDAISFIQEGLVEEREKLQKSVEKIDGFIAREKDLFLSVSTRIKFLHDAYDLRKYAVIIRDKFHVIGYVLAQDRESFIALFAGIPAVTVQSEPADPGGAIPVPVRLRNNWFVRPFEMFVNMYGSPSYNDIDPSPFVAYTYSILFGMMYGDMGHGLCVLLLGNLLWAKKRMELGRIMSRIGVASMMFGFVYGSVFGFEHLLDPLFRMMGFAEKPIHVMAPSTTNMILVATIGIGATVIMMVILFNICVGIKHRDVDRMVFSHNGFAGLVFYGAVLFAAVSALLFGRDVLSTPYILCFIALPLLLMFLREPIANLSRYHSRDVIIHSDRDLAESTRFQEGGVNIPELFTTQFVTARFGRIPTDSYQKLTFYQNEPFMIYPLKTDREYIWLIYAMAVADKEEIDAIFHDLYFERIFIPDEDLASPERAETFIKRCVDTGSKEEVISGGKYGDVTISRPKTIWQNIFPHGFGGFFTETFFEMFEVCLSFVTNTMSFLRVGGFILVHAGMMEVVFKLSEMVGGGGSPVIIIVGNLFVMAMEGLIVGIQVLRLEFYEIFSRFFDAAGEPFRPFAVKYSKPD